MAKSVQKGKRGELAVLNFWKDSFPDAKLNRNYRQKGIDIILDERLKIAISVKTEKSVPKKIYDYINEIDFKDGQIAFVQVKREYKEPLIVMRAKDFKELI